MKLTNLALTILLVALPAPAATIYNSRPVFQSALGSFTNIDFEGLAPSGGDVYFGSAGLSVSGVDITSTDATLFAISATSFLTTSYNAGLGTGDYMEGSPNSSCCGSGETRFALPTGTMAFGLDFRSYNQQIDPSSSSGSFTVHVLTTGGPAILNIGGTGVQFFGYVADAPILAVFIAPNGDNPNHDIYAQFLHFDNVTFSSDLAENAATPELSTAALTATGFFLLSRSRKRNNMFNVL